MSNEERGIIGMIGATKGGVGKSTITCNVAVEIAKQGYRVAVLDADGRQRTTSKFFQRRNMTIEEGEDIPQVACFQQNDKIIPAIKELVKDYDVVMVDTAGRDSMELRYALTVADVFYCITQPSTPELDTMEYMVTLLQETKAINPDRIDRGFLNCAPTHANEKDVRESKNILSDFSDDLPLSKYILRDRKAYKRSHDEGRGVVELNDHKAKNEIRVLTGEILSHA